MPGRALLLCLALAACAEIPQVDARIPAAERVGPPPPLVPLGPILALADAAPAPDPAPALAERQAALEARAAALRGAVLSGPEQSRLAEEIDP